MWPTLDKLRGLSTGVVVSLDRHGPCRFVRLRDKRAVFVRQSDGQRVNLWFADLPPPPAPAVVRAPVTPSAAPADARTAPRGSTDGDPR